MVRAAGADRQKKQAEKLLANWMEDAANEPVFGSSTVLGGVGVNYAQPVQGSMTYTASSLVK